MYSLLVVDGPAQGRNLCLTAGEFTLGSEEGSSLRLEGPRVDPRHARLRVEKDGVLLETVGAAAEIWVDGETVHRARLQPGSVFEIGENVLLFEGGPEIEEESLLRNVQVRRSCDPERAFEGSPMVSSLSPSPGIESGAVDRTFRDREILYRASLNLAVSESEDTLRLDLVRLVQAGTGADRVFFFVRSGPEGAWTPTIALGEKLFKRTKGRGNRPVPRPGPRFSRSVLQETLRSRRSILCAHVPEDDRFASAASLALFNIESVIAIPLLVDNVVVAILYADIIGPERQFTPDDLSLATALAHHASVTLRKMTGIRASRRALSAVTEQLRTESRLVGSSHAMNQLERLLDKVAPTDATVLIRGESGTGKELAARYLHYHSPRAERPFIAINCAALSRELIESELFGHAKGSFTGAVRDHAGRFQQAEGGTLFLDEIGEMELACQAKLLRALETRRVSPVGSAHEIPVDVRILAGTNRDLERATKEGSFREDFYYRLRVFETRMPALRERPEDIGPLVRHFIAAFNEKLGKRALGVDPEVLDLLMHYPWPGNIRELKNVIETAMILTDSDVLTFSDLPHYLERAGAASPPAPAIPPTSPQASLDEVEIAHILRVLEGTGGNKQEAARILKISRRGLYYRLRRHGIDPTEEPEGD